MPRYAPAVAPTSGTSQYQSRRQYDSKSYSKSLAQKQYDWEYVADKLLEDMWKMTEHMGLMRRQWQEEREKRQVERMEEDLLKGMDMRVDV